MTLEQYQAKIEQYERLEVGPMIYDQYDQPCYESTAEQAAEYLSSTAEQIHGIAWQPTVWAWARELVSRAIASADRIARENGKMGGYATRLSR